MRARLAPYWLLGLLWLLAAPHAWSQTATASSAPVAAEGATKAIDGSVSTKWLGNMPNAWLRIDYPAAVAVTGYAITSANDAPTRDPRSWELQRSDDGSAWTTADTQSGQTWSARFQTRPFAVPTPTAARYWRLLVTANNGSTETNGGGAGFLQLAELALTTQAAPPPNPPPTSSWTGDMVLNWTAPTTNVDGSAIAPPISYRVTVDGAVRATVTGLSYTVTGLAAGPHTATIASSTASGFSAETSPVTITLVEPPPNPTCTAPQPAAETQTVQCTAPQLGTWTQTRTYSAAAYPTCWAAGAWSPAAPPAGACTTPAPTPVVVEVAAGVAASPIFGISGTNTRGTTVLGFVPVGKACTGAVVYTYRGRSYRRFNTADAIWWQSAPTSSAAVACN